jgi:hypothetical protein
MNDCIYTSSDIHPVELVHVAACFCFIADGAVKSVAPNGIFNGNGKGLTGLVIMAIAKVWFICRVVPGSSRTCPFWAVPPLLPPVDFDDDLVLRGPLSGGRRSDENGKPGFPMRELAIAGCGGGSGVFC